MCAGRSAHLFLYSVFQSIILLAIPVSSLSGSCFSSSCPCWLCPASRRRNAALVRRRRRRRRLASAGKKKMSERCGVNKRADSSLSFLCEVIMHSPRCFCSHANEVDRVGNHFQTLSRGESRKTAKQRREQKNALPPWPRSGCRNRTGACVLKWVCTRASVVVQIHRFRGGGQR